MVVYGSAVLLASRHGLVVVAFTVAGVYLLILVGVYRLLLQRYVGISIWRLVPELGPAVLGCLALVATSVSLTHLLSPLPRVLTAGLAGSAGIAVYALVVRTLFRSAWNDLMTLVVRVFPQLEGLTGRRARRTATAPAAAQ